MPRFIRVSLTLTVAALLPAFASGQEPQPERIAAPMMGSTPIASIPQSPDAFPMIGGRPNTPVIGSTAISPLTFNGFDQHRQAPDMGAPGSAGHGFFHFTGPLDRFTTWYRPRAATLTGWQRCSPDPFRPRGFGHLFARPCDGYRMEYSPYELQHFKSQYGPSYLTRMPDPRCPDCDPTTNHDHHRKHH